MKSHLRVVLSGAMASYPQGGGHWTVFLQYMLGLRALGHDVLWLDLYETNHNAANRHKCKQILLKRFHHYGFKDRVAVVEVADEPHPNVFTDANIVGMTKQSLEEFIGTSDMLWNFCSGMPLWLLPRFRYRVLVDLDPGILQTSALQWDMGIRLHHRFLTVGCKLQDQDCLVPTLGVSWRKFQPFTYLPIWRVGSDPGEDAPFSSVTEWTWHSVGIGERLLSASKRDAYLRYVELPEKAHRPFTLAANIDAQDETGDRSMLIQHGWRLKHPHVVAKSTSRYRTFIKQSRAELSCVKPVYKDLRTGWFSDRSACYLASGRPVLAEDTGFSEHLPTGKGLLTFSSMDEAVEGIRQIDANYAVHQRGAREIAEEFLNSSRQLNVMLQASQ